MPPFTFLKRFWPGTARAKPRGEPVVIATSEHPVLQLIPQEIKKYLEHHDWKNLSYPPYHEGYPGLVSGEVYLRHFQKVLFDRIMTSIGMPKDELKLYVEPMLVNFAELVHMLPASENHHHSGPGGLLRHSLEVAAHTLDGCLTTTFDANETPSRRSMRARRWYVAGLAAGLLHDSGKPLSDLMAKDMHGDLTWNHERETLHEWSVRNNLSRYFLHWNPSRHGNHKGLSASLVRGVLTSEARAWIMDGGYDIYQALIDAIQGTGKSPLTELVIWADAKSTKRDLNRGSNNGVGSSTGVPVPRMVTDAMLRLVSDGSWKINSPAGRLWVSNDGVYIVWNQAAEEIVNMLVGDGVLAIPRSPDTLIGILVDHGIAEQDPDGELYWLVTPHMLRKNGKGPALRCIKLTNPDILFPRLPFPPPISISLGKEGNQTDVIAPNDAAGAANNAQTDQQQSGADTTRSDNGESGKPAKPLSKNKTTPRQTAPVPAAPTTGVSLGPAHDPVEGKSEEESCAPAADSMEETETHPQPEQDVGVVEEEAVPEPVEPPSLDEMLLFLSNPASASESVPNEFLGSVEEPDAGIAKPPEEEQRVADLLPRTEKISLNALMKQKPAAKAAAPSQGNLVLAVKPEREMPISPTVAKPSVHKKSLPEEVVEKLTTHECYLLEQHPDLAEKLISATIDPLNSTRCRNKVFVRLGKSSFLHEDIHPLVRAGWLWQDMTVEGPALTRALQNCEGLILTADYSLIFCKLAGLDWTIPHISIVPEEELPLMDAAVKSLMGRAVVEDIGGTQVLTITTVAMARACEELDISQVVLENALYCLRDAVKIAKNKKTYIRPLPEELAKK